MLIIQLNGDYLLPVGVMKYYSFSVVKVTQTFSSLGLLQFLSYHSTDHLLIKLFFIRLLVVASVRKVQNVKKF